MNQTQTNNGNKKVNDFGKTIYIGNMSYRRDEKGIRYLLGEFGRISSLEVITDLETNKSKGYAFVKMPNSIHALKAVKELNGKIVDGRTLKVSIAKEKIERKTFITRDSQEKSTSKPNEDKVTRLNSKLPVKNRKVPRRKERGLNELFAYINQ